MPTKTGTFTIADLIENRDVADSPVAEIGPDALVQPLQEALDVHNAEVAGMLADIAAPTTERVGVYGVAEETEMLEADEFTRAPTQKGYNRGKTAYPMDKRQYAMGWTNDFFQRATVAEMAERQIAAQRAHVRALRKTIRNALFGATNYTVRDRFVDGLDLTIRRLANGDGEPIPEGPNGEEFDAATHTHYNATADVTAAGLEAGLDALIEDVVEHGHGDDLVIYINRANADEVQALPKFKGLQPVRIIQGTAEDHVAGALDITKADNREIGVYNGVSVWTKPWVPVDYYVCTAKGDARKPLKMRQPTQTALQGLRRVAEFGNHPLHCQYMEALFGLGAWTRTNGAILHASGGNGGVYVVPTFTS
jgi:hypothetical protein